MSGYEFNYKRSANETDRYNLVHLEMSLEKQRDRKTFPSRLPVLGCFGPVAHIYRLTLAASPAAGKAI